MEHHHPTPSSASHSRRSSPSGKPPPPPRVTRSTASMSMAFQNKTTTVELLGHQLVASLDDTSSPPSTLGASFSSMRRVRSDSTLSTDTFDGIYSLGDGVEMDDVDMVADDELGEIDVDVDDVFRPGALLDRRLEDEFGATRTSDLERMLLAGSGVGEDDEEDTEAVIAHLAQLDSMQLAQEKEAKKTQRSGFCALVPRADAVLVVAAAAVVDTLDARTSSQHLEIAAALPPKYVADQRCRAHKRTFGERMTSFNFRFPNATLSNEVHACKVGSKRGRSLFQEAAEDIAMRGVDRDEKENLAPAQPATSVETGEHDVKMEEECSKSDKKAEIVPVQPRTNPLPQQLQPQTPVRSLVHVSLDAFKTPIRRSVTAPTPSTTTQASFQTPTAPSPSGASQTPTSGVTSTTTMSPAPSFDKVAVVHAKDTPGRVDKFEWTIRPREAIRAKTALFSSEPATPLAEPLPPRYLGDPSGSPQKRRIHSTTFGTFARSFSFK